MKCSLTTQEKLRDLRAKKGYKLQQVEKESGISSSTISNYENDETKDFQVGTLRALADFYDVSLGYLLGLTDNLKENDTAISELHIDDETIAILKGKKFNIRLLCEIIKHPSFANFMCDMEIYVDNLAGSYIHNLNRFITSLRDRIKQHANVHEDDFYMKTMTKSIIDDSNYFGNLIERSIREIAVDIREAHKKDWDTGDQETIADKYLDFIEDMIKHETNGDTHPTPTDSSDDKDEMTYVEMATVVQWSKKLDVNLAKLTPEETRELVRLITKGTRNPLLKHPPKGRGKKR